MTHTAIPLESGDIHKDLHAYNAAFYELGFRWHWDMDLYQGLLSHGSEEERIRAYLEQHQAHLLTAYEVEFLVDVIQKAKSRCCEAIGGCGPDSSSTINWADFHSAQVGI
jgi:hypothetical protein